MLSCIKPRVSGLICDFEIDNGAWHDGCFRMDPPAVPVILVYRYLPGDEGFSSAGSEAGLKKWVPAGPERRRLLAHLRRSQQMISLTPIPFYRITHSRSQRGAQVVYRGKGLRIGRALGPARLARICEQLCGCLARTCDGLIGASQAGLFSPEGQPLLPGFPPHKLKTS